MIKDNKNLQVRPKNWTVPVALVLLREEGSHGYELMERLEEFGFEEVDAGTLYRTLRRMEKEGLCESEWETSESGPARRTYSVTDAGEEYLAAWAEGCKRYQNLMDCFYCAYESSR
jgi:poly-beta-hydroxybutyrate-responsive repressor